MRCGCRGYKTVSHRAGRVERGNIWLTRVFRYTAWVDRALVIAAILIALGGGYLLLKGIDNSNRSSETPGVSAQDARITTKSVQEDTDTYRIDVKYPQFNIPAIDADIKSKIDVAVAEFKTYPPNPPESAVSQNEFIGTYEDLYVGPDIVSVALVLSQYTGGAHPLTIVSGLNYDRASGRQLLQEDAFALIGKSLEDVSANVTAELGTRLGEAFFPEGANTNPENFSSFLISQDTVTFIFQEYQAGPYAAGPQEVSFKRVP